MTREPVGPVRLALLHPQCAWVEALELLMLQWSDVEVVIAHTNPDWVRGAIDGGIDVLVIGMSEDDGFGPSDIEQLRGRDEHLQVVVVNDATDTELFVAAFRAGARAWLDPSASAEELVRAIHGVSRGETWVPPAMLTVLIEALLTRERVEVHAQNALSALSARELEVLDYLAQGLSRAQIAERFTLSPHTVRTHINHVLTKLDVHNTLSAVSIARKARLEHASH